MEFRAFTPSQPPITAAQYRPGYYTVQHNTCYAAAYGAHTGPAPPRNIEISNFCPFLRLPAGREREEADIAEAGAAAVPAHYDDAALAGKIDQRAAVLGPHRLQVRQAGPLLALTHNIMYQQKLCLVKGHNLNKTSTGLYRSCAALASLGGVGGLYQAEIA